MRILSIPERIQNIKLKIKLEAPSNPTLLPCHGAFSVSDYRDSVKYVITVGGVAALVQ
jgi:hypothetical protein